jgi:hypothetical protein
LRDRLGAAFLSALVLTAAFAAVLPQPTHAAAKKVAIIVGPTGAQTDSYRSSADAVASAATAAGATVVKVYSPNATWANVKNAVNGANIIVWMGHGNGFPNPYSTTELTKQVNGWGLNRTTTNGDGDSWSSTMVYCGERALLGTLTSADGDQWKYCGGSANNDGITPAPGFAMIYAHACYTAGAGEPGEAAQSESTYLARAKNYSAPALRLGAAAYFATTSDQTRLVSEILTKPGASYGEIFRGGRVFSSSALRTFAHAEVTGNSIWLQNNGYHYAFAGDPNRTPSGALAPRVVGRYPGAGSLNAATTSVVTATFDQAVTGVSGSTFSLRTSAGLAVAANVAYNAYWKRAELRPTAELVPGTSYVVTIGSGISGATGQVNPLSWSFTTAGTPPVAEGEANYSPAARVLFRQGTHTGYQFNSSGAPVATRTVTLATDSGANTSMLRHLPNQAGGWFYIVNGAWAGFWVRQSSAVALPGATAATRNGDTAYSPPARLLFSTGTHTGYRFSSTGALVASRTVTLATDSGANASSRVSLTNQYGSWFSITNGAWAGYWMRESDVVRLP